MIFVDTWAWVALADRSDPYHRVATTEHRHRKMRRDQYVTSDWILGETITYLYDALPSHQARSFINSIISASQAGLYRLERLANAQFDRAWQMRQKYADKPDISFVDFTSMVVMQDLGINEIVTGDQHFVQVNLGFRLLP
jgi:predicted nucleic acid-binding protein